MSPVPRTGGLAILASVMAGLVLSVMLEWSGITIWGEGSEGPSRPVFWILGLTLIIGAVSFWDDQKSLPVGLRLGVHALAAGGVVWGASLTVDTIVLPLLGKVSLGWIAVPVTILFLMWMTNLYNFMDGMDGFAAGMTVFGFGMFGYVAWRGGNLSIAFLCFLIAAASSGFLYHNMPPARIFMGDVGSVSLGFLVGAFALWGIQERLFDFWVPVLIFSPFIVDATVTLFRRLLQGEKVWQAHRSHYYQRLVLAGWGHRKTVWAEYVLMLACGMAAVMYGQVGEFWRLTILLGWMVTFIVLTWGVSCVERQGRGLRAEA